MLAGIYIFNTPQPSQPVAIVHSAVDCGLWSEGIIIRTTITSSNSKKVATTDSRNVLPKNKYLTAWGAINISDSGMQLRNNNESDGDDDGNAGICLPTATQKGQWMCAGVSAATQLSLPVVSQRVDIGLGFVKVKLPSWVALSWAYVRVSQILSVCGVRGVCSARKHSLAASYTKCVYFPAQFFFSQPAQMKIETVRMPSYGS